MIKTPSLKLIKHLMHVILFLLVILIVYFINVYSNKNIKVNRKIKLSFILILLISFKKLLVILAFPKAVCTFLGLVIFNAFDNKKIKKLEKDVKLPLICFRVVTRGLYPELVQSNVKKNLKLCDEFGLKNFLIEVITQNKLNLKKHIKVKEIGVPLEYETKKKTLFKARSLQYCFEEGVSNLEDQDWIVHLDEETLLTKNSLNGIVEFILDGKFHFGQGLITFANGTVENWFTTYADNTRVADDMGRLRFMLKVLNKPVFIFKGSYIVAQVAAEKHITFDFGPKCSITEDMFFALKASQLGYKFKFINGEMEEISTFTIGDFLRQRKRWFIGLFYVALARELKLKIKIFFIITFLAWTIKPLIIFLDLYIFYLYGPLPLKGLFANNFFDFVIIFSNSCLYYLYIFGHLKQFSLSQKKLNLKFCLSFILNIILIPVFITLENLAVLWGEFELLFKRKRDFYIVQKYVNKINK